MTIYFYSIFIFLNSIFAFKKKTSRLLVFFTLVFILLMIVGAGPGYTGIMDSNDYSNYKIRYDKIGSENLLYDPQIGYTILMKIGHFFNLDFFYFRFLIIGICLFLIYFFFINRYSKNYNYILLLYMIYPMIIDSEHFRNFIALAILLLGIRFLENNSFKNKLIFFIIIIISSSIHFAFILYLFLLLGNKKNSNKIPKVIAIVAIILSVIVFINNNRVPFLMPLLSIIGNEKLIRYLTSRTNYGFLIPFMLYIINFIMIFWSRQIVVKNYKNSDKSNSNDLGFINLVYSINIIGFIFFPLYMLSITFYRLARNFLILNFISYSIASDRLNGNGILKLKFNFSVILSVIIWVLLTLWVTTSPERVLVPFFTKNIFFE
jgi:hypothetical protein